MGSKSSDVKKQYVLQKLLFKKKNRLHITKRDDLRLRID